MVHKQDKSLYVDSGAAIMTDVSIYDIRGRLLYKKSGLNTATFVIDNMEVEQQVLIVNIVTEKGKMSKKVIF